MQYCILCYAKLFASLVYLRSCDTSLLFSLAASRAFWLVQRAEELHKLLLRAALITFAMSVRSWPGVASHAMAWMRAPGRVAFGWIWPQPRSKVEIAGI